LLRKLWTDPLVSFDGQFDHIDRASLNPRPTRRIPIWVGGFSDAAYRRAAQLADGFIFVGGLERAVEGWARIEHFLAEAGRAPADFGKEMVIGRLDRSPQDLAARIEACREWGCTHVAVDTMGKRLSTAAAHIELLSEVRARLLS